MLSRRFVVRLQELSSTTTAGCRWSRNLWRNLLQLSRHHYNPLKPACRGCSSSGSSFAYFSCRRFACWLRAASSMQRPRDPDGRKDLEPQPSPSVSTFASFANMLPLRLRSLHLQFLQTNFALRPCRLEVCCVRDLRKAGRQLPCLLCQFHLRLQLRCCVRRCAAA